MTKFFNFSIGVSDHLVYNEQDVKSIDSKQFIALPVSLSSGVDVFYLKKCCKKYKKGKRCKKCPCQ